MGVSNFAIGLARVLFSLPGRDHDNLLEFVRFPRRRGFSRRCALKGRFVARQTSAVTPEGGAPGASPGPRSRNRVHNRKVALQHPVDLVQVQSAVEVDQDDQIVTSLNFSHQWCEFFRTGACLEKRLHLHSRRSKMDNGPYGRHPHGYPLCIIK